MAKGRRPGTPKTGGRKKGTPNEATPEVKTLAQRLVTDKKYLESLAFRLMRGEAGPIEGKLWEYAWGKPKEAPESLQHEVRVMFGGRFKEEG